MGIYTSLTEFFQDGGAFMVPIALVFSVGLAIAIERWIFLGRSLSQNKKVYREILPLIRDNKYESVISYTQGNKAPLSRIVEAAIGAMRISPRRDDIQFAMQEGVMETMPRLSKRTNYLASLANVATLLGLLGTIIGLIAAFTAVANADPADKATLLSQSISVAMNTTAFGLIAAIPLLLVHSFLQNKTIEIVDSIEMAGVKFLNAMVRANKIKVKSREADA